MSNSVNPSNPQLPSYITNAVPNSAENRAPWYKNTAPTYAGIFLWFVFWQDAVNATNHGGALSKGLGVALLSIIAAGLICHFLFYLVPGLLGQKTGLPLYIVGTSTFGAKGGFIMPGFLMGLLQFGWLGVNIYFSSLAIAGFLGGVDARIIMVVWGVLAAVVGLKGIQYVAKVATYLPLIPIAVLLIMLVKSAGGVGAFNPELMKNVHFETITAGFDTAAPDAELKVFSLMDPSVIAFVLTYVVGFFATAGAAGVDFGTSSRHKGDVRMGGIVGVALAIILTAGLSAIIVAGVHGSTDLGPKAKEAAKAAVVQAVEKAKADNAKLAVPLKDEALDKELEKVSSKTAANMLYQTPNLLNVILDDKKAKLIMFLLALSAFPSACFSSFIAANSFKTTLSGVSPFVSVGIGAAVSILLAVTGYAGQVIPVFVIIGASFGPICGAMTVDYLINGGNWSGPRAGFNPAGWIAWLGGFIVGIIPNFGMVVPAAPVAAFVVGAVLYFICAKMGLMSAVVPINKQSPAMAK